MRIGLFFWVAFFVFCFPFLGVGQVVYTVNTTDDVDDGVCDGVHCSLLEAIDASNSDGLSSNIYFNLNGSSPFNFDFYLPTLDEDSTIIDGFTQPNFEIGDLIVRQLTIRSQHNEIYGLWFDQFSGLDIDNSNNIIGAEGKGNIFTRGTNQGIDCGTVENIIIAHNYIGTTPGLENMTNDLWGVACSRCSNSKIEKNIFGHNDYAILIGTNADSVELIENSFFCNGQSVVVNSAINAPVIQEVTNSYISGTTLENTSVELYYTDGEYCTNSNCQGTTFIGQTQADNLGNWTLSLINPLNTAISSSLAAIAYNGSRHSIFSCYQYYDPSINLSGTYIVNITDDNDDGNCNETHCSLREAINASNNDTLNSQINFNIPGNGTFVIYPNTDLPRLSAGNLILDATTQPNYYPGQIVISGSDGSGGSEGFYLSSKNNILKGLTILDYTANAILCTQNGNLISNNIIGNSSFAIQAGGSVDSIEITGNRIGVDFNNNPIPNKYGIRFAKYVTILRDNIIAYNETAIYSLDINYSQIDSNQYYCNLEVVRNVEYPSPTISNVNDSIQGTSSPNDTVLVYIADEACQSNPCQGFLYLGKSVASESGIWKFPTPQFIESKMRITAMVKGTNSKLSGFSGCYIVLPDICNHSELLNVNKNSCSSVGIVLDLKELTASTPAPTSSCASTFQGNDAWYKIVVPSTGNFLVRTNINNTVVPVIELYTGCGNTALSKCGILDTLPYMMTFENYTPGDSLLLRVWDKDNAIVNSAGSALLHLTAHKLDSLKSNWIICDYENLISGNPTNLSRREASTFILSYEPNTPQNIIDQDSIAFTDMMQMEKKKSCLCGTEELQLWGTDTPVELDGRKRYAKSRGSVDTTNYNYIFETVEFQVNSYAIGQQHSTDIAMDQEGNFVMVWKDEQREHNYGRVYLSSGNPVSVEFQIGYSAKTQYDTKVAMLDNGEFITVWHEIDPTLAGASFAVYGRLFDAAGDYKSHVFEISKPSATTYTNIDPKIQSEFRELAKKGTNAQIAINTDGSFIVVWQAGGNVFAQQFDTAANLAGNIIEIGNTINTGINPNPAIAINASGQFIIAWTGIDEDGNGIYAQRFAAGGTPLEDAFLVNTNQNKNQSNPDITLFDDGTFIVTWESFEQFSVDSDYDIYAQRFSSNGNTLGSEFLINTYTEEAQRRPSISHFSDGNFLVAWSSFGQDGYEEGVYAMLFNTNGISIAPSFSDSLRGSEGHEFRMNAYHEPQQDKPRIATNGENIFMGAWEDGANDGSFEGIFAQRYESLVVDNTRIFKPIGTATPSILLGDQKAFAPTPYNPGTSVKKAKVAIIDTGVDNMHSFLNAAIWNNPEENDADNCLVGDEIGYDFVNRTGIPSDLDGHGTQVNGILTDGFDTDVKLELMNLKFHELNNGSVFDAICAIYYAVDNGANVLNLSWGFEASEEPIILKKALQYASDNDVLIVTTAGNTSKNNDIINKYPANLDIPNMIVVTSYHYQGENNKYKLANYASYGQTNVDIAAYGYVETAKKGGGKAEAAGTSMAAPAVARTAATIKGLYPILTAAEIKDCILSTVLTKDELSNRVATGGILSHSAALTCAQDKAELIVNNACSISGLAINANPTGACNATEGTIDLSFSGNDPNPKFLWSTGETTQNLNNLSAGIYSVTVTDNVRCEQTLDITITNDCISNCQTNLVMNSIDMNGGIYRSDNTITSSGTIEVDSNVVFKAAESITLSDGFHAKAGSEFTAIIEDCEDNVTEPMAESRANLAIKEASSLRVKLYPNPTQSVLNVEVNKLSQGFDLELYDVMGRKLDTWQVDNNKTTIPVNHLSAGIYFLRIDSEVIKKFVVGRK